MHRCEAHLSCLPVAALQQQGLSLGMLWLACDLQITACAPSVVLRPAAQRARSTGPVSWPGCFEDALGCRACMIKFRVTASWQGTFAWTALYAACLQVNMVPVTPPLSAARAQQPAAGAMTAPAMQQTGHAPQATPAAVTAVGSTTQPVSLSDSSSGARPKAAAPAEPTAAGVGATSAAPAERTAAVVGTTSAVPAEPTAAGVGTTSAAPAEPTAAGIGATTAAPAEPTAAGEGATTAAPAKPTAAGEGATSAAPAPASAATGTDIAAGAGGLSWADRAKRAPADTPQSQAPLRSAGFAGSQATGQVGGSWLQHCMLETACAQAASSRCEARKPSAPG